MKACFLSLRLFYFWVSTSCAQIIWLFVNHLIVGQVCPGWPSPHALLILADRSSKGFISQPVCFEIKFLFQCFLFAIVLFPTLPIRRFLQPRPKVGWALTSLQPRRSTNSTRFVLKSSTVVVALRDHLLEYVIINIIPVVINIININIIPVVISTFQM